MQDTRQIIVDAEPQPKAGNGPSKTRLLFIAAAILVGLWFSYKVIGIIFLFFFAIVLALVLNAPVMWLVSKKVPRTGAALLVFGALLLFLFLIGRLVVPRMLVEVSTILTNLPTYFQNMQREVSVLLEAYPELQEKIVKDTTLQRILPSVGVLVARLSSFSFSAVGGVFLLLLFLSLILYMLIDPRPLIETYLTLFSKEKRPQAAHALARDSVMMVGYMRSNLIVGLMEATAVCFVLSYLEIPGVWIWVGLALFAEFVPKLGPYVMAIPPALIALSIDPKTALYVVIFYLILNEAMGNFVVPKVRASTMNLHPISSLIVMLAMGSAFGIVGALIATPLAAFIKAYYETFYLAHISTEKLSSQIDDVLQRRTNPKLMPPDKH